MMRSTFQFVGINTLKYIIEVQNMREYGIKENLSSKVSNKERRLNIIIIVTILSE